MKFKNKSSAKVHDERNIKKFLKDSVFDFSFCVRLQYGVVWHC